MKSRAAILALSLAAGLPLGTVSALAQDSPGKVPHRVPRVTSQVRVDGELARRAWQARDRATRPWQR